jgi:hypothetical protein
MNEKKSKKMIYFLPNLSNKMILHSNEKRKEIGMDKRNIQLDLCGMKQNVLTSYLCNSYSDDFSLKK